MLLAAGLGTRLRPLTARRPKCLMPVMNRPLLGLWLERLAAGGAERVVVNTHHLAHQVHDYLREHAPPGLEVVVSHEPQILGTGGGLVAARSSLGEAPFVLANADVVCSAEPASLLERLQAQGAVAVLGLVDDPRFNTVAVDGRGRVLGFRGETGLEGVAAWRTYTGLAAIHPRLLDHLPALGYSSLVEGFRRAIAAGEPVLGLDLEGFWDDLGTPRRLWALHRDLARGRQPELAGLAPREPVVRGEGAVLEPGAEVEGFCVLGPGARVEAGARVREVVLLPGARVCSGAVVEEAVLGDGFIARGHIRGGAHA